MIDWDQVKLLMSNIKAIHTKIRSQNYTRKTKGQKYPISVGYSPQVKRPIGDLSRWMSSVEDLLEMILEELD